MITGEEQLFMSVIVQAYRDAKSNRPSYERAVARMFLTGANKEFKEHLKFCCEIARVNPDNIMRKAKKLWKD